MATQIVLEQWLFQGKTAQNTTAVFPGSGNNKTFPISEFTVYVTFDHTSAAGVVVIETAVSEDYAGTWANIGTVNWAAIDKAHYVSVTGVFKALRVRISSAVTSGTCDAYLVGKF